MSHYTHANRLPSLLHRCCHALHTAGTGGAQRPSSRKESTASRHCGGSSTGGGARHCFAGAVMVLLRPPAAAYHCRITAATLLGKAGRAEP